VVLEEMMFGVWYVVGVQMGMGDPQAQEERTWNDGVCSLAFALVFRAQCWPQTEQTTASEGK
jgi:hypothetical protein